MLWPGLHNDSKIVPAKCRTVVAVQDREHIRKIMYLLSSRLLCCTDRALAGRHHLAAISGQSFDSLLLDLRCCNSASPWAAGGIRDIRPTLLGQVLLLTVEVSGPGELEVIDCASVTPTATRHTADAVFHWLHRVLNGNAIWGRSRRLSGQPHV